MIVREVLMVNEEWLTVQEAASRLKVQPETIRVWLRDRRLKGTQPLNRRVGWRIPASEVERLLRGEPEDQRPNRAA
jgi:excisionase family DNA binding protein